MGIVRRLPVMREIPAWNVCPLQNKMKRALCTKRNRNQGQPPCLLRMLETEKSLVIEELEFLRRSDTVQFMHSRKERLTAIQIPHVIVVPRRFAQRSVPWVQMSTTP